jgi:hypothetical protein
MRKVWIGIVLLISAACSNTGNKETKQENADKRNEVGPDKS